MNTADKLLTQIKEDREIVCKMIKIRNSDTNDYDKKLGAPWYFGQVVYAQDLRKLAKAREAEKAIAEYAANNWERKNRQLEIACEALKWIAKNSFGDLKLEASRALEEMESVK